MVQKPPVLRMATQPCAFILLIEMITKRINKSIDFMIPEI